VSGQQERVERRVADRRTSGSAVDVSRLEHENLFRQVDEVLRRLSRLELEMSTHQSRIEALEKAARDVLAQQRR
jgi:hypothetical protein